MLCNREWIVLICYTSYVVTSLSCLTPLSTSLTPLWVVERQYLSVNPCPKNKFLTPLDNHYAPAARPRWFRLWTSSDKIYFICISYSWCSSFYHSIISFVYHILAVICFIFLECFLVWNSNSLQIGCPQSLKKEQQPLLITLLASMLSCRRQESRRDLRQPHVLEVRVQLGVLVVVLAARRWQALCQN